MNLQQIFHTASGNFSAPNFQLMLRDFGWAGLGQRGRAGAELSHAEKPHGQPEWKSLLECVSKAETFTDLSPRQQSQPGASGQNERRRVPSRVLSSYHAPSRTLSSFLPPQMNLGMQIKKGGGGGGMCSPKTIVFVHARV